MIEVLLTSFTGLQIIILVMITVIGGFLAGALAFFLSEIIICCGVILFIQFMLFWTSAHLDMVLYGFESGILRFSPGGYIALHHSVQIAFLWASFAAGRAVVLADNK
ncbi:hypothetical protein [Jannaschia marina]|uniref:hypothetical protein n=1 Tax=Jannaschia marina TaxID=2741674 RepID=UPI0015CDAD60|nr:hypothetical protein [Jannaschia marina]